MQARRVKGGITGMAGERNGKLYVVATPIGNLGDLSSRAIETFRAVDRILAEDTRVTQRLLAHAGVRVPIEAYHAHNEVAQAGPAIERLRTGEAIALVTDAGTPAVSDPGAHLVAAAHAAGIPVVPIPGPSAAIAAVSAAGLPGPFVFLGFLPAKSAARVEAIGRWRDCPANLVLLEAPHRIKIALVDLAAALGVERTVVIARELTKVFEQVHRTALGQALAWVDADPNRERGEFVIVVSGAPERPADDAAPEIERVLAILLETLPVKQAVALATRITGARRNDVYARALALKPGAANE